MIRFLVTLFFIFFVFLSYAQAQQEIQNIQIINKSDSQYNILVQFLNNYQEIPNLTHGLGWSRLAFPNSSYFQELSFIRVNDGFIKAIRFFPMVEGSLMEIEFSDFQLDRSQHIDFLNVNGNIEIGINVHQTLAEKPIQFLDKEVEPTSDSSTESSKEKKLTDFSLKKEPLFNLSSGKVGENNWGLYTLEILLVLVVILMVFYLLTRLYRKFLYSKVAFPGYRNQIKTISSFYINPKLKIMILEIQQKKFAVGVTSSNISLISVLEETDLDPFQKIANENSNLSVSELRSKYLRYRQQSERGEVEKNNTVKKLSFSEELQKKLSKMKPFN